MKITPNWIRAKFEKLRGEDPFAKTWEEVPAEWQSSMLQGVALDADETPICAITSPPNPVVFTTKRIIWRSNSVKRQLLFTEFASVEAPESFRVSKLGMSKLLVTGRSGDQHLIVTGPGKTLFTLWNLLLKVAPRNRSSRELG